MWLDALKVLIVNYHFLKLSGDRPCRSSNAAAKTVYVTLQEHVIKGSVDLMEQNSSMYILTQVKLISIDMCMCKWICNNFALSFDLARLRDYKVL